LFFETSWKKYISKVITVTNGSKSGYYQYSINLVGEKEFIKFLNEQLQLLLNSKGSSSNFNLYTEA
jgi:hypothetical protein